MKHILVPVDFSDISMNALKYALDMFKGKPLAVTLAHFYGTPKGGAFLMKNIDRILEKEAQESMNALIKQMEEAHSEVSFISKTVQADASSTICDMGNSGKYDYIIMGTKGASGLKEVFMGSVAGGVIAGTSAPVMVVPANYVFKAASEVLMTIGKDPVVDDSVIEPLIELLKITGDQLKILHVVNKSDKVMEVPLGKLKSLVSEEDYIIGSGDLNKDLNSYIIKDDAQLLCMVRTKKGFFNRIFGGSATLKQTFNSTIPLLILHE